MARVLVVDDELQVLQLVGRILTSNGHDVDLALDADAAMEILNMRSPDVIVLDIIMPGTNGLELCRTIREHSDLAHVPVLFLTGAGNIEDKINGFGSGGDDYVVKPFEPRELTLRINALLRASERYRPPILECGEIRLYPTSGTAVVNGDTVSLTPVEFELLSYLIRHKGEIVPARKLLREVWGYPAGVGDPSLVRTHIMNLRRKIESDPKAPTLIRTVPRYGYTV
ncbi:MAG: response regulator transcription factor [Anaerolineae bacterium]|nr:response regulator transcription factor [Anaerolineae bacterium]